MNTSMQGPFVNLNGATREDLMEQAWDVSAAAESLIQALGLAAPHRRDYQTVSAAKFQNDRDVWEGHLQAVNNIFNEYRGIVERLHKTK